MFKAALTVERTVLGGYVGCICDAWVSGDREDVSFTLDNSEKRRSNDFVRKYMAATKGREDQHDASALTLLVKAMQEGKHQELRELR